MSSVQSLSHVQLFGTPWTVARQASLSITKSQNLLKLMSLLLNLMVTSQPLPFWLLSSIWQLTTPSSLKYFLVFCFLLLHWLLLTGLHHQFFILSLTQCWRMQVSSLGSLRCSHTLLVVSSTQMWRASSLYVCCRPFPWTPEAYSHCLLDICGWICNRLLKHLVFPRKSSFLPDSSPLQKITTLAS